MSQVLPDGSQQPPLLQLLEWIANPFGYMERSAQRYGDPFTAELRQSNPLVFFSHPQAIQAIFTAAPDTFDAGRANGLIRPLVGDNSLLLLDGDRHAFQRHLMMPPFHGERMRSYGEIICQIAEQVASKWIPGQPFRARDAMQEITLQVILHAVFGLADGDRYQQLKPLLASLLNLTGSRLGSSLLFLDVLQKDWGSWSPWGRFKKRHQEMTTLLSAEIAERRAQVDPTATDILTLLIAARDEQGQGMSDEELRDELITLLAAGHETTATTLAWAFYWIHKLPAVQEKLLQELASLGDNPSPMEISRLPYLNAVCSETLRIYPVTPIVSPRILKVPIEIMGYLFEPETMLAPCIYLTHQREDIYPEPQQFKPERFLERQFSPYEYLPFGGGNRRCIGFALALFEMKLVLATVLSRYQLALVDKRPVQPVRRGVTIAPQGGVQMVITSKR
ncbi:MAG: cytochrome P450 [Kastovskya adunca ATA6-11-RM4]|jgi:cytochrome P450|nr:cytochrome P450 [Kastovskya adunca ATA6-11-RM4]